jgi:hypothetical protein
MMNKKNVVEPSVTPCSTPDCAGTANVLVDGAAKCPRCASEKQARCQQSLSELGSNPRFVNRHG